MSQININTQAIHQLVNDPSGPIANQLRDIADQIAEDSKQALSVPAQRVGRNYVVNDTGVPFMRTGDLVGSVRVLDTPTLDENGLITYSIIADAVHGGRHYAQDLRERDFRLAPDYITNAQKQ